MWASRSFPKKRDASLCVLTHRLKPPFRTLPLSPPPSLPKVRGLHLRSIERRVREGDDVLPSASSSPSLWFTHSFSRFPFPGRLLVPTVLSITERKSTNRFIFVYRLYLTDHAHYVLRTVYASQFVRLKCCRFEAIVRNYDVVFDLIGSEKSSLCALIRFTTASMLCL